VPPHATAIAWRKAAGLAAATAILTLASVTTAPAEGLFDFLFGGSHRAPPPVYRGYAPNSPQRQYRPYDGSDRRAPSRETVTSHESETGAPRVAFCVRLCDGRYFPIASGRTAAETCNSLCPTSPTKLFYGRQIDSAHDRHGQAYSKLDNAFVYRTKIVPSCTCNGRSGFGVAQVPISQDPTLRSGDIVARGSGLTVYRESKADREPRFTPIDSAKISQRLRDELEDVKVAPRPTPASTDAAKTNADLAPTTTWQQQALAVHKALRLSARAP
jgi:Protein of unknown function (DUF2865)